jgi:hypothetical protein
MQQSDITLYIIKLIFGGIGAFLAIMLWSRTKDGAWMSLVAGAVIGYAGIVFEILSAFGVITSTKLGDAGALSLSIAFAALPLLFFIIAFAIMLIKNR